MALDGCSVTGYLDMVEADFQWLSLLGLKLTCSRAQPWPWLSLERLATNFATSSTFGGLVASQYDIRHDSRYRASHSMMSLSKSSYAWLA